MTYLQSIQNAAKITAEQIAAARSEIDHSSDGPITAFVLITRATRYAAQHPELERAAAEALAELLACYQVVKPAALEGMLRETDS
jgi:hypothetical protein